MTIFFQNQDRILGYGSDAPVFYAISYDIRDDKRRNSVSKILEGYGCWVQLSLFECNLASDRLQEILQKLESCIDTNEDSVRCYPLCNACANIEEFRAPVIDSLIIYLVNSKILKAEDFRRPKVPGRPCLLSDEARRKFIRHFEHKMHTEITHPHTGFHTNYRRCIELQVRELVRCIRGEAADYRPMTVEY